FAPFSEIGSLYNQASTGLRGYTRSLSDGALRQAALSWWPGTVPAGRLAEDPWAFWDFFPTACDLAGVRVKRNHRTDGQSLVPYLRGGRGPQRDIWYWELHEGTPIQAVRFGKWKAVRNAPRNPIELYDLDVDPGERSNVAASRPAEVARAEALFRTERTPDPRWPL
ncbi:MAG: sulfatase/phosphatase domain-containing protein, partial [Armatimonadaceae bacterium]